MWSINLMKFRSRACQKSHDGKDLDHPTLTTHVIAVQEIGRKPFSNSGPLYVLSIAPAALPLKLIFKIDISFSSSLSTPPSSQ